MNQVMEMWKFVCFGRASSSEPLCFHCNERLVDIQEGGISFRMECPNCTCECRYRKENLFLGTNGLLWPCDEHRQQLEEPYYA